MHQIQKLFIGVIILYSIIFILLANLIIFIGYFLINKPHLAVFYNDGKKIHVAKLEIVSNDTDRARGLMGRENLAADFGMLFKFDDYKVNFMWMKNMKTPIDIIFMDKDKSIIKIYENVPICHDNDICPIYSSEQFSKYALELPAGTVAKYNINLQTKIDIY